MSTLSINANLKFIEFVLHAIDTATDTTTVGAIKSEFAATFKTDMPILMNQDYGVVRLIPLLLMRESLKKAKVKTNSTYDRRIDIVRHALAHDNFSCDASGYKFDSDSGSVQMSYPDFVAFIHKDENEFYNNSSEQCVAGYPPQGVGSPER